MMKLPPDTGGILIRLILQIRNVMKNLFGPPVAQPLNTACKSDGVGLRDGPSPRESHHGHAPNFSHNRVTEDCSISTRLTRGLWDFGSEPSVTHHTLWEDDNVQRKVAYGYASLATLDCSRLPC